MGKKTNPNSETVRLQGAAPWPGMKNRAAPKVGSGSGLTALRAEHPEHCYTLARTPVHTRSHPHPQLTAPHACTHARVHTHKPATHCPARSPPALCTPQIRPLSYPDPAGRQSLVHKRVHTDWHAPRDPEGGSSMPARAGTPAHADPRRARA